MYQRGPLGNIITVLATAYYASQAGFTAGLLACVACLTVSRVLRYAVQRIDEKRTWMGATLYLMHCDQERAKDFTDPELEDGWVDLTDPDDDR